MLQTQTIQAVTLESIAKICNRSVSSARSYVNGLGVATKAHGTVIPYERIDNLLEKGIDSMPDNAAELMRESLIQCEPEEAYWLQKEIEGLGKENKKLKDNITGLRIAIEAEKKVVKEEQKFRLDLEYKLSNAVEERNQLQEQIEATKTNQPNKLNRAGEAITSFTQSLLTLYLVIFIIISAETIAQAPLYVSLFGSNQVHGITAAIIIQFVLFLAATTSSIKKKENWYDNISISAGGIWALAAYNAIMNITVLFQNPTTNFWEGTVKIIVATAFAFSIAFVGDQIKLKQHNNHATTN